MTLKLKHSLAVGLACIILMVGLIGIWGALTRYDRNLGPLKILSVIFYTESYDGVENQERLYELGQSIYWTVDVENFSKKWGKAFVQEGLVILDSQDRVIIENPALAVFKSKAHESLIHFENKADLPEEGVYRFKHTLTDFILKESIDWEDQVTVVKAQNLQISQLVFRDKNPEGEIKETAVFNHGELVFVTFDILGLKLQNRKISLLQDLYVFDDSGQPVLEKPGLIQIEEAWENDDILSLHNEIDVPYPGTYQIKIVLHDRLNGKKAVRFSEFTVQ